MPPGTLLVAGSLGVELLGADGVGVGVGSGLGAGAAPGWHWE